MKKTTNLKRFGASSTQSKFKLSLIASSVIALSAPYQLMAADDDKKLNEDIEVIEVKGIRENLQSANVIKREGDTVLDAISAKDIGSLPDRSVLEAIVRLPGVAIERFSAANDPDHFGVEGSGVVVRGLNHTRSEFNGRDTFTADSGRGLSFQDVPPELMGGVQLYKNQSADMIEGGIAGTVNLVTRKPFDSDERVFAFTADATYSDYIDETTPTYSALYSDIFELNGGRVGVLLNYSNSNLKAQSDGVQIGRYEVQNADSSTQVPRTMRLTQKKDDRDREGFASALQWESADKRLLATAQFIRSDSSLAWTENAIEMADDAVVNDLVPVSGTEFEYSDQGLFESGLITSNAGWRGNDAERQPGGEFGAQHAVISRYRDTDSIVDDFGFNLKYRPNETWSFNFDLQYVDSTSQINDYSLMGATRAVVGIEQDGSEYPEIGIYDPANAGDEDYFNTPHNYFWRSAMEHLSDNEGDEVAVAFDTTYVLDSGLFTRIKVGARMSDREQTTRQSTYNWGWLSEAWAGNGSAWFDAAEGELGDSLNGEYEQLSLDDFARGQALAPGSADSFLFPSAELVKDYASWGDRFEDLEPGWVPLAEREGAVGHFTPNEVNVTREKSNAVFIKGSFEGELGDYWFSGNIGLRYVMLDNETDGFITYPDTVPEAGKLDDPDLYLPQDQAAFGNNTSVAQTATSDYENVLPSFNLKVDLNDDMLLRFGFSEAIALPDLGNLRNYVEITAADMVINYNGTGDDRTISDAYYQRYTAKSGNPYLKPMESYNYDLAFEWYFEDGVGSFTTSLFYKDLSNYFINGSVDRSYTNNGVTQVVQVDGAVNGDSGTVKGVEFAYQQFFDFLPGSWSGLGMQMNYTRISEEGSPNSGLAPDKPNSEEGEGIAFDNIPLEGLSKHNLNFVAMYEKHGIAGRLAYNWRSEYLLTTKDVITQLPIFNEANGQLDGSIFYDVNDNFKVGVQGTNLTNTVTHTSMLVDNDGTRTGRSWFVNDRRISLVVKGNF